MWHGIDWTVENAAKLSFTKWNVRSWKNMNNNITIKQYKTVLYLQRDQHWRRCGVHIVQRWHNYRFCMPSSTLPGLWFVTRVLSEIEFDHTPPMVSHGNEHPRWKMKVTMLDFPGNHNTPPITQKNGLIGWFLTSWSSEPTIETRLKCHEMSHHKRTFRTDHCYMIATIVIHCHPAKQKPLKGNMFGQLKRPEIFVNMSLCLCT